MAGVKYKFPYQRDSCVLVLRPFCCAVFAGCRLVSGGHDGIACFVDFRQNIDSYAVHDMVGTSVYDHALYVGKLFELFRGNVMGINFTVNADCTDFPGQPCIFCTSQVQNDYHILFHKCLL